MDSEFANYNPKSAAAASNKQAKSSTPSPEIEEERKVTFKEPSARSILKQEQNNKKPNVLCEGHL